METHASLTNNTRHNLSGVSTITNSIDISDITLYLNSKSEFYRAGWRAAEKGVYRKEHDGDNPFYAEFESGYEDQVANSER